MGNESLFAGEGCTGLAASWCPIHGYCTCPRSDDESGEIDWHWEAGYVVSHGFQMWSATARSVVHYDLDCPLHGETSAHTEAVAGSPRTTLPASPEGER